MDQVLAGVPHVSVYLDDLLVASETASQHEKDVKAVLDRLQEHGLVINPKKCVFGAEKVSYLGHEVSATGISPLPERVDAIAAFPPPRNRAELLSFLGMVNFYRRFIKGVASRSPTPPRAPGAGAPRSR